MLDWKILLDKRTEAIRELTKIKNGNDSYAGFATLIKSTELLTTVNMIDTIIEARKSFIDKNKEQKDRSKNR